MKGMSQIYQVGVFTFLHTFSGENPLQVHIELLKSHIYVQLHLFCVVLIHHICDG